MTERPPASRVPMGLRLPFEPVLVRGDVAYVSGHGPFDGERQLFRGCIGADLTVEQGVIYVFCDGQVTKHS